MSQALPASPSLEQLRKQAKELLAAHRSGDPDAARRLAESVPSLSAASGTRPARLSDAQLAIAREFGFPSWPRLKAYVDSVAGERAARHRPFRKELSYYEDRAEGLLSSHRSRVPGALASIRRHHPRWAGADDAAVAAAEFGPDDAKLVCARSHGFEDWASFTRRVEALARGKAVEPFMLAFQAIEAGDLPGLERLLRLDPGLANAQGTNGNTLLNLAGSCRRLDATQALIAAGADVNLANDKGWTPLHQAAYSNQVELAKVLLDAGARTDLEAYGEGGTPLLPALFWGHREAADLLAERGIAPLNLRVAAGLGRVDLVRTLFQPDGRLKPEAGAKRGFYRPHSGFPVWRASDHPQEILDEALVYAAKSGRIAAMDELVRRGADVNGEPYNGTPLLWSLARLEVVTWLLDHGADVNRRANLGGVRGITPLLCAAWGGRAEAVRLLIDRGADIGLRDPEYHGLVWGWAEHHGHSDLQQWLLEHGSRVNVFYAIDAGRPDRVRELLDREPSLANARDEWYTALSDAAHRGNREIVELLLARGADTGTDPAGKTPKERASEAGHAEIAALLRERGASASA